MIVPDQVRMTRCSTGHEELARVVTLTREAAKTLSKSGWWKLGTTLRNPEDEADFHWDWRELISVNQNIPFFRAACVKTADGAIQAAMLYRVDALSATDIGAGAVFVDRLATAPRNRDELVENPEFRGGGTGLLTFATALSYSLGFSGRINLFPIANEQFYVDRGFVATDVIKDRETLFELPASVALSGLQKRGLING